MTCFRPMTAYRIRNETKLAFNPKKSQEITEKLEIPCGKCAGCLLDKANDWATRCWAEQKYWQDTCFVTLTYNDKHLPKNGLLDKNELQLFWKRLRKNTGLKIKYFACGEYGNSEDGTQRPHYHAIIYGYKPKDLKRYKLNHRKDWLYTSKELEKIWGNGYVIIGETTYQSACYVSRYVTKKLIKNLNVKQRKIAKEYLEPEFTTSSKRTAIGYEYWQDKKSTIIRNSGIMIKINEKVKNKKIPKYYMKLWEKEDKTKMERYKNHSKIKGLKRWKEQLSKTSLTESNYKKQMEESLKIKTQILSRNNQI